MQNPRLSPNNTLLELETEKYKTVARFILFFQYVLNTEGKQN